MPKKKRKQKPPTLRSRIVSLISIAARMKLKDMAKLLDAPYQSLNTEALELRRLGVLEKDDEGFWSLVPEVNPGEFGIEVITSYQGDKIGSEVGSSVAPTLPISESSPTLKDEFMNLLRSVGVKQGIEAIADIYFAGEDIWNARWLYRVLSDYSEGFVTEGQSKLITVPGHAKPGFHMNTRTSSMIDISTEIVYRSRSTHRGRTVQTEHGNDRIQTD